MKLIKFLSWTGISSRSQTKKLLKSGYISLNEDYIIYDENHILQEGDTLNIIDIKVQVMFEVGVVLHKPMGYLCGRKSEGGHKSIFDLLQDCIYKDTLFVAGRLDQDTEGLVYLHSDGGMIHNITSPKKNKEKKYLVHISKSLSQQDIDDLQNGVELDDGYITLSSKVEIIGPKIIKLTITEGKFHQIKRMLESINNEVIYLKRLKIGKISLGDLEISKRRYQNRIS